MIVISITKVRHLFMLYCNDLILVWLTYACLAKGRKQTREGFKATLFMSIGSTVDIVFQDK